MDPLKLLRLRVIMATTLPSSQQVLEGFHLAGELLEAYDAVVGLAKNVVVEDTDWDTCDQPIYQSVIHADAVIRNS